MSVCLPAADHVRRRESRWRLSYGPILSHCVGSPRVGPSQRNVPPLCSTFVQCHIPPASRHAFCVEPYFDSVATPIAVCAAASTACLSGGVSLGSPLRCRLEHPVRLTARRVVGSIIRRPRHFIVHVLRTRIPFFRSHKRTRREQLHTSSKIHEAASFLHDP